MEDFFLIAEISSAFNKDGFVKVKSHSDFPERFFLLNKIYIDIFGERRLFFVEDVDRIEDYFILKFKNFDSNVDVEFLVGSALFVNKKDVVQLDDDTHFIHDLIECKVFFNTKFFGKIVDVLSLTSNDVYVVENENGEQTLIPAITEIVLDINIKEKIIRLKQDFNEFSDDEN
ncbi:MAG: ribosome maturation factor RimM [Melioribacteraceae bacterium]|nr:ribosome maturation factor RimM [Melioribacteraceae bacterium]